MVAAGAAQIDQIQDAVEMPFENPQFGRWRLQFDTHRRYDPDRRRKRVIPVRVYRG